MRNKLDEVQILVNTHNPDVIILSETWFYGNEIQFFCLEGYMGTHVCRDSRGGGLAIYVRNSINHTVQSTVNTKELYSILVSFDSFNLVGINRTPQQRFSDFMEYLENMFARCKRSTVIIGDININLLNQNSSVTTESKQLISAYGYQILNHIDDSTRYTY